MPETDDKQEDVQPVPANEVKLNGLDTNNTQQPPEDKEKQSPNKQEEKESKKKDERSQFEYEPENVFNTQLFHSVGLYSKEELRYARFNRFSRFGRLLETYDRLNSGREYLFFIKPDLHICVPANPSPALYKLGTFTTDGSEGLAAVKPEENKWTAKWAWDKAKSLINDTSNLVKEEWDNFKYSIANSYERNLGDGGKETIEIMKGSDPDNLIINPQLDYDSYFQWLVNTRPEIVKQLQISIDMDRNPFCYLLSSSVSSHLSLDSSVAKTMDNSATVFGTTYNYLQDSEASDESYDFSLEFVDNKFLETYHFFKAYNEYHLLRKSGGITPPNFDYYRYRRLHNTMGIYKFIVAEDMETLIYWAYFWGVIPTSCPREAFTDPNFTDGLTFSVQFQAAFVEDMNPRILMQFNRLMKPLIDKAGRKLDDYLPIVYQNFIPQPKIPKDYKGPIPPYMKRPTGYDQFLGGPNVVSNTVDGAKHDSLPSSIPNGTLPVAAYVECNMNDPKKDKDLSNVFIDREYRPKFKLRWYSDKNEVKVRELKDQYKTYTNDSLKQAQKNKSDQQAKQEPANKQDKKQTNKTTENANQNQGQTQDQNTTPQQPENPPAEENNNQNQTNPETPSQQNDQPATEEPTNQQDQATTPQQ